MPEPFRGRLFPFVIDSYGWLQIMGSETMAKSRSVVLALLLVLPVLLMASTARAEPAFQRLTPLLIDLDGWQGKKADGMSMDMAGGSMTTATREYQKGSAKANVSIVMGQTAVGALAPMVSGMNINTSEGHMLTDTINGMKVLKTYTTAQKSGALLVALDKDAMFSFSYSGLPEDEAIALAQKFDWKAIQAAAKSK